MDSSYYLLYIINFLELTAAILGTVFYHKYKGSSEKYFMYFLWYVFFVDVLGALLKKGFGIDNFWLYNSFIIFSFLFYFYWYYTILRSYLFKNMIKIFSGIFSIVAGISLIYQRWDEYHYYTFVIGALFVLVLTLFHFYKLLNSNEVLIVKYKLSFWISTALLLFYMGMIPLMILSQYGLFGALSFRIILVSLNIILYGCYTIGFLWTRKEYNRF